VSAAIDGAPVLDQPDGATQAGQTSAAALEDLLGGALDMPTAPALPTPGPSAEDSGFPGVQLGVTQEEVDLQKQFPKPPVKKLVPEEPPAGLPEPKHASLWAAVRAGDFADIENHILRGANFDAHDAEGLTPLHHAAKAGDLSVLRVLLDYGADVQAMSDRVSYSTPLMTAYNAKQLEAAGLLRAHGALYDMHHAAGAGDLGGMEQLVAVDPEFLEHPNLARQTPMHTAAFQGQLEAVAYLMEHGADPESMSLAAHTPFSTAAMNNHADIVEYMVEHGVDPDSRLRDLETVLHKKARSGDPGLVDLLLSLGADVNAKNKHGSTPLHAAAGANQPDMVVLFLEKGALIYAADKRGRTPLHVAAEVGLDNIASLLIDKGANVARRDRSGAVPLHLAAYNANTSTAIKLIERGSDVNAGDKRGRRPLHLAALGEEKIPPEARDPNLFPLPKRPTKNENRLAVMELLLARGADVEAQDRYGGTPLHAAAYAGRAYLVDLLLDKGAHIEAKNNNGRTPLFTAFEKDQSKAARLLIDRDADINAQDRIAQIPLHVASEANHADLVAVLLAKGTFVNAKDHNLWTPLHAAAEKGCLDTSQLLLAYGANIGAADIVGRTPLHIAAHRGNVQLVKVFIANGADVNVMDRNGRAPIHAAAWEGHWGPVQVFIGAGANLNVADRNGFTPLHIATQRGHTRMVRLFISRGAKTDVRNHEGLTPLRLAEQAGKTEVVELLRPMTVTALERALKAGNLAEVRRLVQDERSLVSERINGLTPLHMAARNGRKQIAEYLLACGADFMAVEDGPDHLTPLHEAARQGHHDIIELLLLVGANPNVLDARGRTPIHWARGRGHLRAANVLASMGSRSDGEAIETTDPEELEKRRKRENFKSALIATFGNTLSMSIARDDLDKITKVLDRHPFLVDASLPQGNPLHMAISLGKKEVVALLLAKGADVNATVEAADNITPLHRAAREGYRDIAKMLLGKGADVYAKTVPGKTPLEMAQEAGHEEVVALLKAYMGIQ